MRTPLITAYPALLSPSSAYGVQIQAFQGTPIQAFSKAFPNEDACLNHVWMVRTNGNPTCERCGGSEGWQREPGRKSFRHTCRSIYSPMVGTLFEKTQTNLHRWFYAMLHFSNSLESVNGSVLARQIGVSERTAHRMSSRIRRHLSLLDEKSILGATKAKVTVRIQVIKRVVTRGKRNHNKAHVLLMADANRVKVELLKKPIRSEANAILKRSIHNHSIILTDCNQTFAILSDYGRCRSLAQIRYQIQAEPVGGCDLAKGFLASFLPPFKDKFRGVSNSYLPLYLKEFEFRFNRRCSSSKVFWDMVSEFPHMS